MLKLTPNPKYIKDNDIIKEPRIKQCPRCRASYPFTSEYWCKDNHRSTGLKAHCKNCTRLKNKIRYHQAKYNKDVIAQQAPASQQEDQLVWPI